jgi:hypothetical protein
MKKIILAFAMLLCLASMAFADTIYLRDGRTIRGTLLGFINGRFVVRVDTPSSTTNPNIARGEIQYFRPAEVDRIEIDNRSLDEARFESRTVQVALDPNWIDSGVDVRRGERVQISATGVITVGRVRITPDGLRSSDPSAPLPSAAEGQLIGAVGDDPRAPIIELGSNREFTADRDGRLYLTANRGNYSDARGSYTVTVRRERNPDVVDTGGGFNRPGRIRSRNRGDGVRDGGRRTSEQLIEVPGTSRGTDTGIDVRAGDQIVFSATGVVVAGQRAGQVGPEGGRSSGLGSIVSTRPVPTAGVGALVGYIRTLDGQTSQWFFVGSQLTYTVQVDGRLFLAINDDNYNDNSGAFSVTIQAPMRRN